MIVTSAFEQNWQDLLGIAIALGASDLHLEPAGDSLRIRVRVDGVLRTIQQLKDPKHRDRLAAQAKRGCNFDMGRLGVPQDSRFVAREFPFDFRASLIPTLYGEKIVLRLLERNREFSLESYPLPDEAKRILFGFLGRWQGLILVTGPTGSGKSTLLYSALAEIDREQNNVHTLEEPVEYQLPGLNQTPITAELRFPKAVSTLMRQDPDVILIGEIRDEETAHAAMHAASTGHLVLSTVHANSACESITRMQGLGIDKDLLVANLLFASAQRLAPRLCQACKEHDPDSVHLFHAVFGADAQGIPPWKATGCDSCKGTATKGRVLLFEALVEDKPPNGTKTLKPLGSLRESALHHIKEGNIDVSSACAFQ